MSQLQFCLEQPGCDRYSDPGFDWPESGAAPVAPLLFFILLAGIVIWSFRSPPKPPPKSPEEELFEAIGKFEAKRQKAGKQTRFDYSVTDPCVDKKQEDC